jgi:hypothetical protein
MTKQLVLGSVIGAVILFLWSFIAWTFIPWPGEPLRSFTNEDAVVATIKANAPRSGNYLMPNEVRRRSGMTEDQYQKAMQDATNRMMRGPIVFTAVRLEPFGSFPKALVIKFVTFLVAALLASFLLLQTSGLSYAKRVLFLTLPAALIFLGTNADEWNWWGFSNAYTAMQLAILLIGWFMAGLVMALFVRGKSLA